MPNPIYKFPREAFEGSRVPRVSYSINVLDLVTVEHDQPDDCVQFLIRGFPRQTVEVVSREWAARVTAEIEALWEACLDPSSNSGGSGGGRPGKISRGLPRG